MKQLTHIGWVFLTVCLVAPLGAVAQADPLVESVGVQICRALEEGDASFRIGSGTETTEAGEELKKFYVEARCRPAWIDEEGVNSQAIYLIHEIREGYREGLDSYGAAYNLESILTLMGLIKSDASFRNDPVVAAQLDILLTDAYMMLGEHLYRGVLPAEEPFEPWKIARKDSPGMGARLRQALETNTLPQSLEYLAPRYPDYLALKRILERYLRIQQKGGWSRIESLSTDPVEVERYHTDELKERLRAEGDLGEKDESGEGFRSAIIDFQTRHGLKPDGKIGSETLLRLNITVEEKIAAIRLNLERWRWMPETMERSHIAVNIPGFSLDVIENGETLFGMKAIVGKPE